MPLIVKLNEKKITLESKSDLSKIINILNQSFKEHKLDPGVLSEGSRTENNSAFTKVINFINFMIGADLVRNEIIHIPAFDIELDARAYILYEHYKNYLNMLHQQLRLYAKKTEETTLRDKFSLLREILLRISLMTLSVKADDADYGEKMIKFWATFIEGINDSEVLIEKSFFESDKLSLASIALSTTHDDWIELISAMVKVIKVIHAPETSISSILSYLNQTKIAIVRRIMAYSDYDAQEGDLSDNWLMTKFIEFEKYMLSGNERKDSLIFSNNAPSVNLQCIESACNSWQVTKRTPNQDLVLNKIKTRLADPLGYNKVEKLYGLFNRTNLLFAAAMEIESLVQIGGWVPILTGFLNTSTLARLIEEHDRECRQYLKLDSRMLQRNAAKSSYKQLVKYNTPFFASVQSISHNLEILNSNDIKRQLFKIVSGAVQQVRKIELEIKDSNQFEGDFSLINMDKLPQDLLSTAQLSRISMSSGDFKEPVNSSSFWSLSYTCLRTPTPENLISKSTKLYNMIKNGSTIKEIKKILTPGVRTNFIAGDGWTTLCQAIYCNIKDRDAAELVKLLLNHSPDPADPNHSLISGDGYGWTPLCLALSNPKEHSYETQKKIVEHLLAANANPNHSMQSPKGLTPLTITIINRDKVTSYHELVELLLRKGADPNHRIECGDDDPSGWTPLCLAIYSQYTRNDNNIPYVVKSLLEHNANPNHFITRGKKINWTPLCMAISTAVGANETYLTRTEYGKSICTELLNKGANPNRGVGNKNPTPDCCSLFLDYKSLGEIKPTIDEKKHSNIDNYLVLDVLRTLPPLTSMHKTKFSQSVDVLRKKLKIQIARYGFSGFSYSMLDETACNSFFKAVADQLAINYKTNFTPEDLKSIAINNIRENSGDYEITDRETGLTKVSETEINNIYSLSRALALNLIIISSNQDKPLTVIKQQPSAATVFLGHKEGSSFASLVGNANSELKEKIESTAIDAKGVIAKANKGEISKILNSRLTNGQNEQEIAVTMRSGLN